MLNDLRKTSPTWFSILTLAAGLNAAAATGPDFKATKRTAESGDARAQYLLARSYENGAKENYAQAAKWYRKAAEQNYAPAQYGLGRMYATGLGMRQNNAEALRWLGKAAAQGYALAQNRLGVMYEKGEGVAQDLAEAYKWYNLAAGADQNVYAVANRDALASHLTAQQRLEGERRAGSALGVEVADSK